MKKIILLLSVVMFSGASMPASAAEPLPCRAKNPNDTRPRIGLVLGGGGARGVAHISVLKELERLQVPIDCIAGTSMGSLIGGLYASGMTTAEMESMVSSIDWMELLDDGVERPDRSFQRKLDDQRSLAPLRPGVGKDGIKLPAGIKTGEKILLFLEAQTAKSAGVNDFDKLTVPYRAVAADINTGQAVVIGKGNLATAMRASMAIPGAFTPVEIDGKLLVDGGMVNQVPVDVVRAMGADMVIAVDVGTPLSKVDSTSSIFKVADQVIGFLTVGNTERTVAALTQRDILIRPELGSEVTTMSFEPEKIALALRIGADAATKASPRLAALAAPSVPARTVPSNRDAETVIAFIEIDNQSTYDSVIFESKLAELKGKPIDRKQIEKLFTEIYGQYPLDLLTYRVENRGEQTGLAVQVKPKAIGNKLGEFGMQFSSNLGAQTQFNLTVGMLWSPANSKGGEIRGLLTMGDEAALVGNWFQPLTPGGKYFSNIEAGYRQQLYYFGDGLDAVVAEYLRDEFLISPSIGRSFGNWGQLSLGLELGQGEYERRIGSPLYPELDYKRRNVALSFQVDTLDSLYLPRDGYLLDVSLVESLDSWNSSDSFSQANLEFIGAHAIGEHSLFGGLRYHDNYDGEPMLQNWFTAGGVTRFAGYQFESVEAESYQLGFVGYNYRLGQLMGRNSVIGGTLEYGKIWGDATRVDLDGYRAHASVYFGFDSWLGLFLVGYGRSEDGDSNLFLELGRNQF
jgi:NTE family protein